MKRQSRCGPSRSSGVPAPSDQIPQACLTCNSPTPIRARSTQDIQQQLNSPEFKKQMDAARAAAEKANSPEFRAQMEEMRKKAAQFDTPLLFASPEGELLRLDNFRHREWRPAIDAAGTSAISGFNAGTMAAFIAWFGGAEFVLAQYFRLGLTATYPAAVASGLAGAVLIFLFLTKGLLAQDQDLNPADYDPVGVMGRLSSAIREGGTGEIIFSQAGTRRASSARSLEGTDIPRGAQVVVIRYERGIAYVRPAQTHNCDGDAISR